jgi:hypothetical protein
MFAADRTADTKSCSILQGDKEALVEIEFIYLATGTALESSSLSLSDALEIEASPGTSS